MSYKIYLVKLKTFCVYLETGGGKDPGNKYCRGWEEENCVSKDLRPTDPPPEQVLGNWRAKERSRESGRPKVVASVSFVLWPPESDSLYSK